MLSLIFFILIIYLWLGTEFDFIVKFGITIFVAFVFSGG